MSKTQRAIDGYVSPETLVLIDQCLATGDSSREFIWEWSSKRVFYLWIETLFSDCGVKSLKFKGLRRGACSAAESLRYGAGSELLGHRNRQTTISFYIDPTIARREPVKLPSWKNNESA